MRILQGIGAKTAALGALALLCGAAQAAPKKPVLGFYSSWAPPSVRWDKITHLMYAFLLPSGGGSFSNDVPGSLISEAHSHNVKLIASIGGAHNSTEFPGFAASSSGRSAFANSCKAVVNAGADGVDIDWEYPANAQDSANFTLLLKAVRSAIGASKIISMDLAPTNEKGQWVSRSALDIGDFYNCMAYDFTGDFPGSLVGQHSSYNASVIGIYYWWKNRGVAKEKVVMGVPFYGKNFNAGGTPVDYKDIMSANPGLSPDADSVGKTWFNGVTTMKKKATYVAQNSYGGVMIWQLGGDASGSKSLLDAINDGLSAAPISIVSRGAQPDRFASQGLLFGIPRGAGLRAIDGRLVAAPALGIYVNPQSIERAP
jgi:GH18 family chitinase